MVKKLRYYARFIVVTLLLNEIDFVKQLIMVWLSRVGLIYNFSQQMFKCNENILFRKNVLILFKAEKSIQFYKVEISLIMKFNC